MNLQSKFTSQYDHIANYASFKVVDFGNIASFTVENIATQIETLTTDCKFIGKIGSGGDCFISGFHYMYNGSHYWTAIVIRFADFMMCSGTAGSYKKNQGTLS